MLENKEKYTKNKIAIVTGGSRGIGSSIVSKLASNGFTVILNYNTSFENAKKISETNSNIHIFKADVSDYSNVQNLINFAISKFGHIDLLVNNAGIDLIKTITDTTIEDFDNILKTNLYSAFYTCKEVVPYMISAKSGNIINISSIWGVTGSSCETAYSISKAGLDGLTKSLAKELGPSNIFVNSIAPGIIDTNMNNFLSTSEKKDLTSEIPLEKLGTTEDVSDCVLFLANTNYITGQIIQVNGGWYI